jgi:uncharacterized membrane protein YphA (DoxX/SURF4 family)
VQPLLRRHALEYHRKICGGRYRPADFLLHFVYSAGGKIRGALTVNRLALGTFCAISGYHNLFNRSRHVALVSTLQADHVPTRLMQWAIPAGELSGGCALVAGILAPLAALGLLLICLGATLTDGIKRIPAWHPLDRADYYDDVLYLPEVHYCIGLLIVILAGPGRSV